MLTQPKHGWTDLTLDNKKYYRASYLTDVPLDLLEAFNESIKTNKTLECEFDAEGWEHKLVCNSQQSSIIVEDDSILNSFSTKTIYDLAKELVIDIESNFEDWIIWIPEIEDLTKEEVEQRVNKLKTELNTLRELIN